MDARILLRCLILSLASSLDNLAVGVSLGICKRPLSTRLNLIISGFNAAGALLSSECGALLGSLAPNAAQLGGAAIFTWLGFGEFDSFCRGEASPLTTLAEAGVTWRLAVPMTLNNLAGGVAGGLAGVGPMEMGLGALLASYGLMYGGHLVGNTGAKRFGKACDYSGAIASIAFIGLGTSQLADVIGWSPTVLIMGLAGFIWYTCCVEAVDKNSKCEAHVEPQDSAGSGQPIEPTADAPPCTETDAPETQRWPGMNSRIRSRRLYRYREPSPWLEGSMQWAAGSLVCCASNRDPGTPRVPPRYPSAR